jgi:hypothetical protein
VSNLHRNLKANSISFYQPRHYVFIDFEALPCHKKYQVSDRGIR